MSQLNLKIQLRAFDRVSRQFENIRKAGGKLGRQFDNNLAELKKLDGQLKQVNSFRKREQELSKLANKIDQQVNKSRELKQLLANASAEGKSTAAINKLSKQYDKSRQSTGQLVTKHQQLKTTLGQARSSLQNAGINTKNLANTQTQLTSRAETLNQSLSKQSRRLDQLAQKQQKLNRVRQQFRNSMGRAQNMAMAGYAGMAVGRKTTGLMRGVFTPGIDFEEQMSRVGAIAGQGKNSAGFKMLQDQAQKLGASTSFSASQAASGMEYLAMAGFKPKQITAAMPSMLDLAKVGKIDLGQTADIASNVLSAYKLPAQEMTRVADVFAAAITSANVDVTMLGESMKQVAPVAQTLGVSIEETTAMTALLGNIGIQGEASGTALRNLYNRLASPPSEAKKALDQLGIATKDAAGNLRSMPDILAEVARKTEALGTGQRLEAFTKIAGLRAGAAMAELVDLGGADEIEKYLTVLLEAQGKAKAIADAMSDNTAGDIIALQSAWEGFNIAVAGTKTGALRGLIKGLTEVIRKMTEWTKKHPKLTGYIITAIAAIAGLVTVMGGLLIVVAGIMGPFAIFRLILKTVGIHAAGTAAKGGLLTKAFKVLGSAAKWLGRIILMVGRAFLMNPIGLAVTAIAALAFVIYKHWDGVSAFFKNLWAEVTKWFSNTWALLRTDTLAGLAKIGAVIVNWSPLGLVYKAFAGVMNYFEVEMPNTLTGFLGETGDKIMNAIMAWTPTQWLKDVFSGGFQWVEDKLNWLGKKFGLINDDITKTTVSDTADALARPANIVGNALHVGTAVYGTTQLAKKAANLPVVEGIKEQFTKMHSTIKSMKETPFTIKQDATKNMNYQGNFSIDVKTDGSVMSNEVSRLVQVHAGRYFAQQEALQRRALHDTN